jgi:hypothetical protein
VSGNLWTAPEMNVEQQILPIDASLRLDCIFISICFVFIGACNELAMLVCIIFYNKTESSSGYLPLSYI